MSDAVMSADSLEDCTTLEDCKEDQRFVDSLEESPSTSAEELIERKYDTENEDNSLVVKEETEGEENSDDGDDYREGVNNDGNTNDDNTDQDDYTEESDDEYNEGGDSKDDDETDMKTFSEEMLDSKGREDGVPDLSVSLGFSASLDEMLLQHGEFPAAPFFNSSSSSFLRYQSTALGTPLDLRSSSKPPATSPCTAITTTTTGSSSTRFKQRPSPASLPSVVSWRTCGGGEFLWSPKDRVAFTSHHFDDVDNLLGNIKKEGLPFAYKPEPKCSHSHCWLLPETLHPPPPAHQPAQALPSCRYPSQPPAAHWQPPIAHCNNNHYRHSRKSNLVDGEGSTTNDLEGGKCSPRRAIINNVVLNNTRAFQSHPLFPLMRDLAVVDYYFDTADFNLAPLLSFLPPTTEEMVALYLLRNTQAALNASEEAQSLAVDALVLDAVAYTHRSLLEKLTIKSEHEAAERNVDGEAKTMREKRVEELCDRYLGVLRSSTPLEHTWMEDYGINGVSGAKGMMHYPATDLHSSLDSLSHLASLRPLLSPIPDTTLSPPISHSVSTSSYSPSRCSTTTHNVSTTVPNAHFPEDGRRRTPNTHHSKAVREVLRAWLTENQHYPYPDDDQTTALVRLTGLTVQQVKRWLSNARRRHLPRLRAGQPME